MSDPTITDAIEYANEALDQQSRRHDQLALDLARVVGGHADIVKHYMAEARHCRASAIVLNGIPVVAIALAAFPESLLHRMIRTFLAGPDDTEHTDQQANLCWLEVIAHSWNAEEPLTTCPSPIGRLEQGDSGEGQRG